MKNAQFYTFAGVILISLAYVIISGKPSADIDEIGKLKEYSTNYENEARIVINNAIHDKKNISGELRNYTEEYLVYSDSKDLGLGILYLYSYKDNVYIVNYLNDAAGINNGEITILPGEEKTIQFTNTTNIKYRNITYSFQFAYPSEVLIKTLLVQGDSN
ncbi:MAG: hypothetical protein ABIJ34_03775 [archaeon]